MYAYLIKLGQKPNVDGDDEEAAEDSGSDLEIVICELNQKMSHELSDTDAAYIKTRSESPLTFILPSDAPVLMPRRSNRNKASAPVET